MEIKQNIIDDDKCIGLFILETKLNCYNKDIWIEGTRFRMKNVFNDN